MFESRDYGNEREWNIIVVQMATFDCEHSFKEHQNQIGLGKWVPVNPDSFEASKDFAERFVSSKHLKTVVR